MIIDGRPLGGLEERLEAAFVCAEDIEFVLVHLFDLLDLVLQGADGSVAVTQLLLEHINLGRMSRMQFAELGLVVRENSPEKRPQLFNVLLGPHTLQEN
jgi:hypothetical protein